MLYLEIHSTKYASRMNIHNSQFLATLLGTAQSFPCNPISPCPAQTPISQERDPHDRNTSIEKIEIYGSK